MYPPFKKNWEEGNLKIFGSPFREKLTFCGDGWVGEVLHFSILMVCCIGIRGGSRKVRGYIQHCTGEGMHTPIKSKVSWPLAIDTTPPPLPRSSFFGDLIF